MLSEVQIYGSTVFSTIDLQSAFFSIPLDQESSEITAFFANCENNVSSWGENLTGIYKYNRLVMGCQTSSSVLNKAMEITLHELPFVKVYCDDLLIISRTRPEHLNHLRLVFERIREYGVKLAAEKCQLFQTHIEFLGYKIDANEIFPAKDKLKIIQDVQPPRTVKEIRQTLGFFNFYKMFVPNY